MNKLIQFFVTLALMASTVLLAQVNGGGPNGGGGGGGSGTVTSVGLSSSSLVITGSPVTTTGVMTADIIASGIASCTGKDLVPFFRASDGHLACSSNLQYLADVGGTALVVQNGSNTGLDVGANSGSGTIAQFEDASVGHLLGFDANGVIDAFKFAIVARGGVTQTGCSLSAGAGGDGAGTFTSGTTGACSVQITMHMPANNGWACVGQDITHPVTFTQTAFDATHCTISANTTSGDVVVYTAYGF